MRSRIVLARLTFLSVVAVASVSCSDDGGGSDGGAGSAPPTSLTGLLGLVPDRADTRGSQIYYSSFERIRVGLPAVSDALDDLLNLLRATDYQANVPQRYDGCISREECLLELGWDSRSVNSWIEFGDVGTRTEVLAGSFSPTEVESAIRGGPAGSSVQTESVEGTAVITVGTEGQTEMTQRSGYSRIGRGVTVAVTDSLLVSADARADAEAVLTRTVEQSLAQDPAYSTIATALDDATVDYAVLTPAAEGSTWLLAGFGEVVTADDDGTTSDPTVVTYAFVFADNAAAQAGEAQFRSIVETGTSEALGIAWSDKLTVTESSVNDNSVVFTIQADGAGWWIRPLLLALDLLMF